MFHGLERNTELTYIYRLYIEKNSLRYVFSMPVSYRGDGEWEAHAWNSLVKLCPSIPMSAFPEILVWIRSELIRVEPTFKKLTGTFEIDRLKAYARLFRRSVKIESLRPVKKTFNGAELNGMVVEFIPLEATA